MLPVGEAGPCDPSQVILARTRAVVSPRRESDLGLAGAVVLLGRCTMVCHVGLVTQNSIPGLGDAGGAHFTLRVVVLVNALVHTGTGVIDVVVVASVNLSVGICRYVKK